MKKIEAARLYSTIMGARLTDCTAEERIQVMGVVRQLKKHAQDYQQALDDVLKKNEDLSKDAEEYNRVVYASMSPVAEEEVTVTASLDSDTVAHLSAGIDNITVGDLMWIEEQLTKKEGE